MKIDFLNAGSPEPDARSGHRIAVDDGNLYSLGGYNPRYWEQENDDESIYPLFREVCSPKQFCRLWAKSYKCSVLLEAHVFYYLDDLIFYLIPKLS